MQFHRMEVFEVITFEHALRMCQAILRLSLREKQLFRPLVTCDVFLHSDYLR